MITNLLLVLVLGCAAVLAAERRVARVPVKMARPNRR